MPQPAPYPICKSKAVPIRGTDTLHTNYYTPRGTWRYLVHEHHQEDDDMMWQYFPPGEHEPADDRTTQDLIKTLTVRDSQIPCPRVARPTHLDDQETTWCDLGLQPTDYREHAYDNTVLGQIPTHDHHTHGPANRTSWPRNTHPDDPVDAPDANNEPGTFSPLLHTIHYMKECMDGNSYTMGENNIPEDISNLLQHKDLTTKTWATILTQRTKEDRYFNTINKRYWSQQPDDVR